MNKWFRSSFNLKHCITIIAAICFIVAAMLLFSNQIYSLNDYSSFLNSRHYNYSVIINKGLEKDCYALYGKKITFSTDSSLNDSINALSLMEINSNHTEDDFLFDYDVFALKKGEVAVSKNIAIIYDLSINSIIFSKNVISNEIEAYKVKMVLPCVYGVSKDDNSDSKGVIVFGFNDNYNNFFQTDYIFFYKNDFSLIHESGANIIGSLTSINEIKSSINMNHFFYSLVTMVLLLGITIVAFYLLISFNKNIYQKKSDFGYQKLFFDVNIDIIVYYLTIYGFSSFSYFILGFFVHMAIEIFLINTFILLLVSGLSLIIKKKLIRGK